MVRDSQAASSRHFAFWDHERAGRSAGEHLQRLEADGDWQKCAAKGRCVAKAAAKGGGGTTAVPREGGDAFHVCVREGGQQGHDPRTATPRPSRQGDVHVRRPRLWTDEPENDCAASKLRAAARKCSCKLVVNATAARRRLRPRASAAVRERLRVAFSRAEGRGSCTTSGDAEGSRRGR